MDAASSIVPISAGANKADWRAIALLSVTHLVNDANQSALPAIIPWLVAHRGLSLAAAATLVLAMNLSSSVIQPVFGHLSDRGSLAWVVPASVVLACFGTALIGFAPSMATMLLGALVSGIGVAGFHPESSGFANYFGGDKRATAMSWFTTGGYLGFAIGPILITPSIVAFGLHGAAILLIPGIVSGILLWRALPHFQQTRARVRLTRADQTGNDDWRGFSILGAVVGLRSIVFFAGITFLPLFAIDVVHTDRAFGSVALATMLLGGVAGTVWGGRLADRFDRRHIVSWSLALTTIFGAAIAAAGVLAPQFGLLVPLAVAFGLTLGLSASVVVVMGQEYLPSRIGTASGMTLGLSVTIGGLAAPLFGALGDRYGLVVVFAAITLFAVVALFASFFMPKPSRLVRV